MGKHTPGPWRWDGTWSVVVGEEDTDDFDIVAGDIFEDADARLIAAAPELLEALKVARDELADLPKSLGYGFTTLPQLDAAIAKAEGTDEQV